MFFSLVILVFYSLICTISETKEDKNEQLASENYLIRKEEVRKQKMISANISDIDKMNPYDFEEYIAILFSNLGYRTEQTKLSGDYGADVIAKKGIESICIQVKLYKGKVSIGAVQEIVSAKSYYNCNKATIITNSYFTKAATHLARVNFVQLIDRDKLVDLILSIKI